MEYFKIGDFGIAVDFADIPLTTDDAADLFQCEPLDQPDIRIHGVVLDPTPPEGSKCMFHIETAELVEMEQGRMLINHWATSRYAFGVWVRDMLASDRYPVYFTPQLPKRYPLPRIRAMASVGLHHRFLCHGAAIVHASYIDVGGEAILFTAPSGTGKSTQAELWRQFGGAEIINGDRAMIRQRDGIWHAFGYVSSGSSKICLNRTLPLRAIVVLAQHTENVIERMTYPAKIRSLVSATEVYPWLPEDIDMAFGIAEQVVTQVPVIRLRCRPDQGAVECLRNFLEENR